MISSSALNPSHPTAVKAREGSPAVSPAERSATLAQSLAPMLTASVVALLTLAAINIARSTDLIAALWAANAVAAAMWMRSGSGRQFDLSFGCTIAVGVMAGEILGGNTLGQSILFTVANMIEIGGAVFLARRFAPAMSFANVSSAMRMVAATAVVAPIPAAVVVTVYMAMARDVPPLTTFQTWWFGHALGMLVLMPPMLSIGRSSLAILKQPLRLLEWVGWCGVVGGVAYLVYFKSVAPAGYLLNPLVVLIAVRLRAPAVGAALMIISTIMLCAILYPDISSARSPVGVPVEVRVMNAQLMMLFAGVTFLLVAALLDERGVLSARAREGQKRAELATAAKSRLLANVAHEIKSPVAGVIGIGELWSSGQLGPTTPQQKEMADMLVRTARQVETLAHDLLDVARAESGAVKVEARPTDICGVIEDVRRTTALRPEARGLRLEVVFSEPNLVAVADSQRITQVIDNLATNAMKYGASGGVIRFAASRAGERIRIEVTDQGPGLTEAKQVELFEPFNRLGLERSTIEGHGIGLALSKRLVELQDGAIGVISAPGEGATFWIELPSA